MHDDTPADSDSWLQSALSGYVSWALAHQSLLVLTFDEPDTSAGVEVATAPVLTIFVGQGVPPSTSTQPINNYTVLKYILDGFGLAPLGLDASQPVLDDGR